MGQKIGIGFLVAVVLYIGSIIVNQTYYMVQRKTGVDISKTITKNVQITVVEYKEGL